MRCFNRIMSLVLCLVLSFSACAFGVTMIAEAASTTDINVWIIGGQSNAEGYGQYDWDDFAYDERFQNGFPDVLYWGNHENGSQDTNGFVPMTVGHGQKKRSVGAEVGIAAAVSQMGGKHAIIKCAIGSTYLYPYTAAAVSKDKHGTWTSPSYVNNYLANDGYAKAYPANVQKNLTISGTGASAGKKVVGNMFNMMVELTLKPAIQKLKDMGYNPIMRGMWWMQGCAETNIAWDSVDQARISYKNVLKCFINDIRSNLTTIVGKDCSTMPFVIGRLVRNSEFPHGAPTMLAAIQQAQDETAADTSLKNVEIVNPKDFAECAQHDAWHFKATTQKYLGSSFVAKAYAALKINIPTPYGQIPSAYADVNKYPFAVFDKNGTFKVAATILGRDTVPSGEVGAYNEAKKYEDAVIFLRRDYQQAYNFSNLSHLTDGVTLDLGGNRIIGLGGYPVFMVDAKPSSGTVPTTNITVRNGSIKTSDIAAIRFSSWEGSHANKPDGKIFNFTFDGVTFLGSSSNLVLSTTNDETAPPKATINLTFNNCVFDVDGKTGVKIINATDAKNTLTVNATVAGGRILADTATAFSLFTKDDKMPSSFKVDKYNGSYPTLTLLTASAAPTLQYTSESEGALVFGAGVKNTKRLTNAYKSGSGYNSDDIADKAYTDYTLQSKILGKFNVGAELNLKDSLKMSITVPKSSAITAIALNGKNLPLSSLAVRTVGGVECYIIEIDEAAKNAAGKASVTVTATSGSDTVSPTYTVSLSELARTESNAADTSAIKRALSFTRAAMYYFGTSSADTLSEIESVLGADYDKNNAPVFGATPAVPKRENGFAGATLILDGSPRIRFYAYGIDPAKAVFKQGSSRLTTKIGTDNIGKYVDVYVTYENLGTNITYSITGTAKQGAFNLKAYYNWAKSAKASDTKLITLIERLAAYAEGLA
ncbi:MAG: hypothetical protein J6L90_06560 [Clostridia bacterium]|nr:hypothetical protein [Clostridia bacterium]